MLYRVERTNELSAREILHCICLFSHSFWFVLLSVLWKGFNLAEILTLLFAADAVSDRERIHDKLQQFDKEMTDEKFEEFYRRIQQGYEPSKQYANFK